MESNYCFVLQPLYLYTFFIAGLPQFFFNELLHLFFLWQFKLILGNKKIIIHSCQGVFHQCIIFVCAKQDLSYILIGETVSPQFEGIPYQCSLVVLFPFTPQTQALLKKLRGQSPKKNQLCSPQANKIVCVCLCVSVANIFYLFSAYLPQRTLRLNFSN